MILINNYNGKNGIILFLKNTMPINNTFLFSNQVMVKSGYYTHYDGKGEWRYSFSEIENNDNLDIYYKNPKILKESFKSIQSLAIFKTEIEAKLAFKKTTDYDIQMWRKNKINIPGWSCVLLGKEFLPDDNH